MVIPENYETITKSSYLFSIHVTKRRRAKVAGTDRKTYWREHLGAVEVLVFDEGRLGFGAEVH